MWSRVRLLILLVVVAVGVVWVYNATRSNQPDETAVDAVARDRSTSRPSGCGRIKLQ